MNASEYTDYMISARARAALERATTKYENAEN